MFNVQFKQSFFYRFISVLLVITFSITGLMPPRISFAQPMIPLPAPGIMLAPTPGFVPPLLKGIKIDPQNPLHFDFIIDLADNQLQDEALRQEADRLVKYFLASLTVPKEEMWVNLSPYEKDRIIPESFGVTEMGRDLLAQDYILKQLTASLIYPEKELGEKFWKKVHKLAYERFGITDIPVNTFNKVWIVPEKAIVYENGDTAFVVEAYLKVMLEEDYVALQQNLNSATSRADLPTNDDQRGISAETNNLGSEIIREIILPEIEKEVNEGENFANLRQIYHSMILATWFKRTLYNHLLNKIYVDQNKTEGVDVEDKQIKQKIYEQYLEAFKTGVYNYIKEDYDPATQEIIPRKYFSGGAQMGIALDAAMVVSNDPRHALQVRDNLDHALIASVGLKPEGEGLPDQAMVVPTYQGSIALISADPRLKGYLEAYSFNYDEKRDVGAGGAGEVLQQLNDPPDIFYKTGFNDRTLNEAQALDIIGKAGIEGVPRLLSIQVNEKGWIFIKTRGPAHALTIESSIFRRLWPQHQIEVILKAAEILKQLHERSGLVHNDVKPEHILFDDDGEIFLIDYGIATVIGQETDWGADDYVAPEKVKVPRSDVYGLGKTIRTVFSDQTERISTADWENSGLKALIEGMTAEKMEDRPEMDEVIRRLEIARDYFGPEPKGAMGEDNAMLSDRSENVAPDNSMSSKFVNVITIQFGEYHFKLFIEDGQIIFRRFNGDGSQMSKGWQLKSDTLYYFGRDRNDVSLYKIAPQEVFMSVMIAASKTGETHFRVVNRSTFDMSLDWTEPIAHWSETVASSFDQAFGEVKRQTGSFDYDELMNEVRERLWVRSGKKTEFFMPPFDITRFISVKNKIATIEVYNQDDESIFDIDKLHAGYALSQDPQIGLGKEYGQQFKAQFINGDSPLSRSELFVSVLVEVFNALASLDLNWNVLGTAEDGYKSKYNIIGYALLEYERRLAHPAMGLRVLLEIINDLLAGNIILADSKGDTVNLRYLREHPESVEQVLKRRLELNLDKLLNSRREPVDGSEVALENVYGPGAEMPLPVILFSKNLSRLTPRQWQKISGDFGREASQWYYGEEIKQWLSLYLLNNTGFSSKEMEDLKLVLIAAHYDEYGFPRGAEAVSAIDERVKRQIIDHQRKLIGEGGQEDRAMIGKLIRDIDDTDMLELLGQLATVPLEQFESGKAQIGHGYLTSLFHWAQLLGGDMPQRLDELWQQEQPLSPVVSEMARMLRAQDGITATIENRKLTVRIESGLKRRVTSRIRTVLIVDDATQSRGRLMDIMNEEFNVVHAENEQRALETIAEDPFSFDVVVGKESSALAIAEGLKALSLSMPVIIASTSDNLSVPASGYPYLSALSLQRKGPSIRKSVKEAIKIITITDEEGAGVRDQAMVGRQIIDSLSFLDKDKDKIFLDVPELIEGARMWYEPLTFTEDGVRFFSALLYGEDVAPEGYLLSLEGNTPLFGEHKVISYGIMFQRKTGEPLLFDISEAIVSAEESLSLNARMLAQLAIPFLYPETPAPKPYAQTIRLKRTTNKVVLPIQERLRKIWGTSGIFTMFSIDNFDVFETIDKHSVDFQTAVLDNPGIFEGKDIGIIGVGTGIDLLNVLKSGAKSVWATDINPMHVMLANWNFQFALETGQIPPSAAASVKIFYQDGFTRQPDADIYLFNAPRVVSEEEFIDRVERNPLGHESFANHSYYMKADKFFELFGELKRRLQRHPSLAIWRVLLSEESGLADYRLREKETRAEEFIRQNNLEFVHVPHPFNEKGHSNIFYIGDLGMLDSSFASVMDKGQNVDRAMMVNKDSFYQIGDTVFDHLYHATWTVNANVFVNNGNSYDRHVILKNNGKIISVERKQMNGRFVKALNNINELQHIYQDPEFHDVVVDISRLLTPFNLKRGSLRAAFLLPGGKRVGELLQLRLGKDLSRVEMKVIWDPDRVNIQGVMFIGYKKNGSSKHEEYNRSLWRWDGEELEYVDFMRELNEKIKAHLTDARFDGMELDITEHFSRNHLIYGIVRDMFPLPNGASWGGKRRSIHLGGKLIQVKMVPHFTDGQLKAVSFIGLSKNRSKQTITRKSYALWNGTHFEFQDPDELIKMFYRNSKGQKSITVDITEYLGPGKLKAGQIGWTFPLPNGKTWDFQEFMRIGKNLSKVLLKVDFLSDGNVKGITFIGFKRIYEKDYEMERSYWEWTGEAYEYRYKPGNGDEVRELYQETLDVPWRKIDLTKYLGESNLRTGQIRVAFPLPNGELWGADHIESMKIGAGLSKVEWVVHYNTDGSVKAMAFIGYKMVEGREEKYRESHWLWDGTRPVYQVNQVQLRKKDIENLIRKVYSSSKFDGVAVDISDFVGKTGLQHGILNRNFPLPKGKRLGKMMNMRMGTRMAELSRLEIMAHYEGQKRPQSISLVGYRGLEGQERKAATTKWRLNEEGMPEFQEALAGDAAMVGDGYDVAPGHSKVFAGEQIDGMPAAEWLERHDELVVKGERLKLVPLTRELLLQEAPEFLRLLNLIAADQTFSLQQDVIELADDPNRFDPQLSFAVLNELGKPVAVALSHPKIQKGKAYIPVKPIRSIYFSKVAVDPYFQWTAVILWLLHRHDANAVMKGYIDAYWESSLKVIPAKLGTERTDPFYKKIEGNIIRRMEARPGAEIPMPYYIFQRNLGESAQLLARQFVSEYNQQRAVEAVTDMEVLKLAQRLLKQEISTHDDEYLKSPYYAEILKLFGADNEDIHDIVVHKVRSGVLLKIVGYRMGELILAAQKAADQSDSDARLPEADSVGVPTERSERRDRVMLVSLKNLTQEPGEQVVSVWAKLQQLNRGGTKRLTNARHMLIDEARRPGFGVVKWEGYHTGTAEFLARQGLLQKEGPDGKGPQHERLGAYRMPSLVRNVVLSSIHGKNNDALELRFESPYAADNAMAAIEEIREIILTKTEYAHPDFEMADVMYFDSSVLPELREVLERYQPIAALILEELQRIIGQYDFYTLDWVVFRLFELKEEGFVITAHNLQRVIEESIALIPPEGYEPSIYGPGLFKSYFNYLDGFFSGTSDYIAGYLTNLDRVWEGIDALEIGPGRDSRMIPWLKEKGATITAGDLSWRGARLARRIYGVKAERMDILKLSALPKKFDVIVAASVLYYALTDQGGVWSQERTGLFIEGLKDILKPGGILAATFYHRETDYGKKVDHRMPAFVKKQFTQAGFVIEEGHNGQLVVFQHAIDMGQSVDHAMVAVMIVKEVFASEIALILGIGIQDIIIDDPDTHVIRRLTEFEDGRYMRAGEEFTIDTFKMEEELTINEIRNRLIAAGILVRDIRPSDIAIVDDELVRLPAEPEPPVPEEMMVFEEERFEEMPQPRGRVPNAFDDRAMVGDSSLRNIKRSLAIGSILAGSILAQEHAGKPTETLEFLREKIEVAQTANPSLIPLIEDFEPAVREWILLNIGAAVFSNEELNLFNEYVRGALYNLSLQEQIFALEHINIAQWIRSENIASIGLWLVPTLPYLELSGNTIVNVPGGLRLWQEMMGPHITEENLIENISYDFEAIQIFYYMARLSKKRQDILLEGFDVDSMYHAVKVDRSDISHRNVILQLAGIVHRWTGDEQILREGLGLMMQYPQYNVMFQVFDLINITKIEAIRQFIRRMEAIDRIEDRQRQSVYLQHFQGAVYILSKISKNNLFSVVESEQLFLSLVGVENLDGYQSWLQRELVPRLRNRLGAYPAYSQEFIDGLTDQDILIYALLDYHQAGRYSVSVQAEADRINAILVQQDIDKDDLGEFLLGLSYAKNLQFFDNSYLRQLPNGLIKRHVWFPYFGSPWSGGGFATYEEGVPPWAGGNITEPTVTGGLFLLGSELSHLYEYMIFERHGIPYRDSTAHNPEISDRLGFVFMSRPSSINLFTQSLAVVNHRVELAKEVLTARGLNNRVVRSYLVRILGNRRSDQVIAQSGISMENVITVLTPSELYYLGKLFEQERISRNTENKKKLEDMEHALIVSGETPESIQKDIDQVIGVSAKEILLSHSNYLSDEILRPYEQQEGAHLIGTRISADLNIQLALLMFNQDISYGALSYIHGKAFRYVIENVGRETNWSRYVEAIRSITQEDILGWFEELKEEGLIIERGAGNDRARPMGEASLGGAERRAVTSENRSDRAMVGARGFDELNEDNSAEEAVEVAIAAGVHIRPAERIIELMHRYPGNSLVLGVGGESEVISEVTDIISLGLVRGDQVVIKVDGPQARDLLERIVKILTIDEYGWDLGMGTEVDDEAMVARPPEAGEVSPESEILAEGKDVGGIDMNPDMLELQTQGQGMDLQFDPAILETMPITGFTPIIYSITPVTNLPLLLGIADDEPQPLAEGNGLGFELSKAIRQEKVIRTSGYQDIRLIPDNQIP